MIGSVLDKYEILQKIGEGGMATVYRGRHTTLGRDVAIKILHPHLSRSERNRHRFAREARAIEHLDHDNILKIFDYSGTDAEDCYIVTEFVDGVTLQALVSEHGRIPSEVVALIGLKLSEALGYAHALGIIHRDLKPENVMVRRDGGVKLMDFGIARFLDEVNLTVTGALVGSPAYMSPEQAMEKVLDLRSDLFSLGSLLFHLLTGQLPFSGNNPSIILRNIIDGNRPEVMELAPDVSGSLADLVESLLQTSPDDRPAECRVVVERLHASLKEVRIDPADPAWALQSWLVAPGDYEKRLHAHLCVALLEEGRARLDRQDHLGALRLFNRLLSLDEDNQQVLELVESMHIGVTAPEKPARRAWIGGGLGLAAAAALLTWALWPERPPPADFPVEEPASVLPTPIVPVVELPESPAEVASPAPTPAPAEAPPPTEAPSRPKALREARKAQQDAAARAAAASEQGGVGKISVVVPGAWAYIWIDGENVGRTGKNPEIEVTPGKHVLELRNPAAETVRRTFEVAAGEHKIIDDVTMTLLPAVAWFSKEMNPECRVRLDGSDRGTVGALGRRLEVPNPQETHTIDLACPGAAPRQIEVERKQPRQKFAIEPAPGETAAPDGAASGTGP